MKDKPRKDSRSVDLQKIAALRTQLDCLKSQINPHFLFNNLSILSSLVQVDPDLSEQFIEKLSKTYRYILDQRDLELVSLRAEIDFIASFSFLLNIRFSDKFNLMVRVDEAELDRYKLVPLTLQLLVENAVTHNGMSVKNPLVVEINLQEGILLVKNNRQPRPAYYQQPGQGLQNLSKHYAAITARPLWAGIIGDEFVVQVPLIDGGGI